jgi:hypothetical protein
MKNKQVIYLLESVDTVNYTGVLKHKPATPKNAKWVTTKVRLSGLLNSLIKGNDVRGLQLGDTLVGTQFTSETISPNYHDNPFMLVKYIPSEKSDIPENYMLKLVNQNKGIKEEITDLYQNKFERWHNKQRIFNSKYFKRFVEVKTDELLKNLKYQVVTQ